MANADHLVGRSGASVPVLTGLTADTGNAQSGATELSPGANVVAVCANAGDSVQLPKARKGIVVLVKNLGAASCDVFPNADASGEFGTGAGSDDIINEGSANAAVAVAANASLTLVAVSDTEWEAFN